VPALCDLFNPNNWGLPIQAVQRLGDDLRAFWKRFRARFRTRTRDTSEQAYGYWLGQLTREDARNFTNIERRLDRGDGQNLQQFMTDSPWSKQAVCDQIQDEIGAHPALQHGGLLILDESSDETAGEESAGAGRPHNGRLGKIELSVTTVGLTYAHPATGTWVLIDGELFLQAMWFTQAYAERRQKQVLSRVTLKQRFVWSLARARGELEKLAGRALDWTLIDSYLAAFCTTPEARRTVRASSLSASLEMAREGAISIRQDGPFAPLWIKHKSPQAGLFPRVVSG
jgi:hypothetical protein